MNRILNAIILTLLLILANRGGAAGQCGEDRWLIKTGNDPDASQINLSSIIPTTIADLTAISRPSTLPEDTRVKPTETTTWVLNATMVKYVRSHDSDYHIVLKDSAGRTMIGEIPDPNCVETGSPLRSGITRARAQFNARFTATSSFQNASVPVRVTGVGFFDYNEGQEGIAPNAIELHPIIDIAFGPTFSLSTTSSMLHIAPGSMGSRIVTSAIFDGFDSEVSLSAGGLPGGGSVSFAPSSVAAPGSGSTTITISLGASTDEGTYPLVINGYGGGHQSSVILNLIVESGSQQQFLGNPGFENGSGNPSPWVASSGVIDNSGEQPSHGGSWKAWLNGYGTEHTDSLSQPVNIPSDATTAAFSYWRHIDTTETSAATAYDTLRVQILNSSGAVLSTLATYSNLNTASGYTQSSFDLLPFKGQSIQIYLVGVEDASLKTSFVFDDFALNISTSSSPNLAIAVLPKEISVKAGSAGTATVTTSVSGGFTSAVSLSATGLPQAASANFSPASVAAPGTGSSTMTISTGASTPTGKYSIVVKGNGGGLSRSSLLILNITAGVTQQLLVNGGFENGSANPSPWKVTAGVINNNPRQTPRSGSWNAWLNGLGAVHTDTLYQQLTIPSNATSARLSFWRHIETAETTTSKVYDTLKLQIRSSSGAVLATLATYSNLNAAAGYTESSFDLSTYKGQTIQVYLIGVEDSSLKTSFVFDDFALHVTTP